MGSCEKILSTVERYQQRFARVLAHIEANSETPLSLDALSGLPTSRGTTSTGNSPDSSA
jgi:hypothetical protein